MADGHQKRGKIISIVNKYTSDDLIKHLKDLSKKLGRTPTCSDVKQEGRYSYRMYLLSFGSLRKAQALAGLEPNRAIVLKKTVIHTITRKMCLKDIERIKSLLDRYPSMEEIKDYGKYSFHIYFQRLGEKKWLLTLPEGRTRDSWK